MKLRVLVDNNTKIDHYYFGEPGLCYYIEEGEKKILFDTGYSDIFMRNAKKMGIDLKSVDTIVFSHGHNDHTQGFRYFAEKHPLSGINVIAHPYTFNKKVYREDDFLEDISSPFRKDEMEKMCRLNLTGKPLWISDKLVFLGEIPVTYQFEKRNAIGQYLPEQFNDAENIQLWPQDFCVDDTALAYKTDKGVFIITGCSHSGICNITEYAKSVTGDERIIGIIGGFHMFKKDERLSETIRYLKENNVKQLYPCHCVSFKAKAAIHNSIPVHEVAVGLELNI